MHKNLDIIRKVSKLYSCVFVLPIDFSCEKQQAVCIAAIFRLYDPLHVPESKQMWL
jgi:hypothetical protein